MQSVRASVSLRPKLYQWVKEQAESRQISISRYIERCVEEKRGDDDDELAYPKMCFGKLARRKKR